MTDLFTKDAALAVQETPKEVSLMPPMEMLQLAFQTAINRGGAEALAVADRILEQIAKQRDYEDRDRFNASLLNIQKQLKRIPKRGWNDSTKSWFAKPEDVDKEIQVKMQDEGMSLSFEPEPNDQPNMVTIVGILSQGAYSRRYPLPMPCDGQGAKGGGVMTRTHATGSAITYAKRYLKDMIFDLGFREKDDDGNQAGNQRAISEKEEATLMEWEESLKQAPDLASLKTLFADAYKFAKNLGDGPRRSMQTVYEDSKRRLL